MLCRHTVKPVLNGQSKTDKTKVFKTGGSLMQVKRVGIRGAFCNTFDCIERLSVLKTYFWSSSEWLLKTGFNVHLSNVLTDHLNILVYIKAWFLPNKTIKLLLLYYTMTYRKVPKFPDARKHAVIYLKFKQRCQT